MRCNNYLFTSESVTEGHPDKVCDLISDGILDEYLRLDPESRVACETTVTTNFVFVTGEITSKVSIDIERLIRKIISGIGYDKDEYGFNGENCKILVKIHQQSPDIAMGVGSMESTLGAGDQGMMFGYATDETNEYMPYPIWLAHRLAKRLTDLRKNKVLPYLRPDGKTQVSIEYDSQNRPCRLDTVVLSTQHDEMVSQEQIHQDIKKYVLMPILPAKLIDENTKIYINPTGRFVIGGPDGDSGLTGRKIIVDTYGGHARHGGGAFSGKDPTKVDRSAAYAARHVAKNIVAAELAKRCEVQLAYAIGIASPVSININTFGTGILDEGKLVKIVEKIFDLSPAGIIHRFMLRQPIYSQTAAYGHFGRNDLELPWERLDMTDQLADISKMYLPAS